jgi:hypothetical protein
LAKAKVKWNESEDSLGLKESRKYDVGPITHLIAKHTSEDCGFVTYKKIS